MLLQRRRPLLLPGAVVSALRACQLSLCRSQSTAEPAAAARGPLEGFKVPAATVCAERCRCRRAVA